MVGSRGSTSGCGLGLDLLDGGVEPVEGAAGTGHLGQVHLVDVAADDECRDVLGEAGLIVKRGRVRSAGRDGDGGDHIIDGGDRTRRCLREESCRIGRLRLGAVGVFRRRLEGEPGAATLVFGADDGLVPSVSVVAHPVVAAATQIAMIVVTRVVLRGAVM